VVRLPYNPLGTMTAPVEASFLGCGLTLVTLQELPNSRVSGMIEHHHRSLKCYEESTSADTTLRPCSL